MSLCPNCADPGDKQAGAIVGKIATYAGVEAYVVGDNKDRAIIYCTDIFGHDFLNHHKIADGYAAAGYTVIIPKILNDAMDANDPTAMNSFMEWLGRNSPSNATEVAKKVVTQMNSEFKNVTAFGFCYGARVAVDLLESSLVRSTVVFHPTFMKLEDVPLIKSSNTPILFNCASDDYLFTPELRSAFEAELKGANGTFLEYADTIHGFAARPKGEEGFKRQAEAHNNTREWLNKTLA